MKTLLLVLLLASPVAAQTIGGPQKPANQIGGPPPQNNRAVAHPRGAPTQAVTPVKPLVQKPAVVLPHSAALPLVQRGVVPSKTKAR